MAEPHGDLSDGPRFGAALGANTLMSPRPLGSAPRLQLQVDVVSRARGQSVWRPPLASPVTWKKEERRKRGEITWNDAETSLQPVTGAKRVYPHLEGVAASGRLTTLVPILFLPLPFAVLRRARHCLIRPGLAPRISSASSGP